MEFFSLDELHECLDCGHKSVEWGEVDELVEYCDASGEEAHQVLCPKCGSWFYFTV